jgi:hypothetical protein
MKRWILVVLLAVVGMQVIGCKAKGEVDDPNKDTKEMKVKVDTK